MTPWTPEEIKAFDDRFKQFNDANPEMVKRIIAFTKGPRIPIEEYEKICDVYDNADREERRKIRDNLSVFTISFSSEQEYSLFLRGVEVVIRLNPDSRSTKTFEHELEHRSIYQKYGVESLLGMLAISNGESRGYIPYCQPVGEKWESLTNEEQDRIQYESLQRVGKKSERDLKDIERLEKMYPELKK